MLIFKQMTKNNGKSNGSHEFFLVAMSFFGNITARFQRTAKVSKSTFETRRHLDLLPKLHRS